MITWQSDLNFYHLPENKTHFSILSTFTKKKENPTFFI